MKTTIAQGWNTTCKHFKLVVILFLYRLAWGIFLYRFIDDIVTPLLRRYPSAAPTDYAVQTFLTEAQFQLFKTDLIMPYVWMLIALFGVRILITPIIHSGLFYSFHRHFEESKHTHFREGIGKCWKPVALIYLLETILIASPIIWLMPKLFPHIMSSPSFAELAARILPYALGLLAWAIVIHLLSLSLQFGAAGLTAMWSNMWRAMTKFLPYILLSLCLWCIALLLSALFSFLSMIGAGIVAILLHQGSQFISTWMKIWTFSSQSHYLFHSKKN